MSFSKNRLLFAFLLLGSVSTISAGIMLTDPINMSAEASQVGTKANARDVTINGDDYASNFTANGEGVIAGNTATLTPDQQNKAGNTVLNTKIDMTQSFSLKGKVDLGNKSQAQGGADGMSFIFQPGDTDVIGKLGGAMGFGGVKGSFGFKLDTFYNGDDGDGYTADPTFFADSDGGKPAAFGAFVNGTTGVADTLDETAQQIAEPSNNEFKDIEIDFDGTSRQMTVTYDGKVWDITSQIGTETNMSFAIAASTGSFRNLQQFQLESFSYTVAQGTVKSHYVDENGQTIADDVEQSGDLGDSWQTEAKVIPGYTLKEVQGNDETGYYKANDQSVTYVYTRDQGAADVTYVDDTTGKTLVTDDLQGNSGDKSEYTTGKTIKDYEDKGYELVSDDFPTKGLTFAPDMQHYTVHLKHRTTPVNPENPGEPGTPINPTDPDGPKWPEGTDKDSLTKSVTETIHYIYEDGSKASEDVIDTVSFGHELVVDNVTGEIIIDNGWSKIDKDYFDQKNSPEINDYSPNKSEVAEINGITPDSKDVEETVVYTKNLTTPIDPVDPTEPELPGNNAETGEVTGKNLTQVMADQKNADSLPRTDMNTTSVLSFLGILIAVSGVTGYYAFGVERKD
ncbi:mucus-binding protein [Weissella muntiaci]|uniref:Mucus-binding protein n=1 Tax=Weissella muntiaci TaxID=2508881 RepID=A0A6C2C253_9LACO|nr:MucBP domain-containing protein [Weissella muntiaci]TYC47759.1 mucus-binding protein [Weissella muntiaci]